ncbi:MAG: helix-turn-helix transcriptional regulator [Rhodobacteraceae bacterium]|nr:helix-turn-helix transcriptional regulator [Paracoccaceae bacterium]
MVTFITKRARAETFRQRLTEAMAGAKFNKSTLAAEIRVDRSTISQLLAPNQTRLPNAQVVAEAARALKVSADWLLGLSQRPERANDLLDIVVNMPEAARSSEDEQLVRWHQEAAGYKIRHVPATLPDFLKTSELLRWEYQTQIGKTPDQAVGAMKDHLSWMRLQHSDYEIAMPLYELQSFAAGTGYYSGLSPDIRAAQIEKFIELHDALYPSLRVFQFDAHQVFSAPMTVFGPLMSALYLGRHYIVFRDSTRVQAMTNHFDWLVRAATIDARDFGDHLKSLRIPA